MIGLHTKKWLNRNNYLGFTLSEVLITLAIIGIIATITVPTLYSSYKQNETVSRLKKGYSLFNQVIIGLLLRL